MTSTPSETLRGQIEDILVDSSLHPVEASLMIMSLFQSHTAELEKAYGGCHNCYGKGYATYEGADISYADFGDELGGASSRKHVYREMKFCDCGRGKQLELQVAELVKAGKLEELKLINMRFSTARTDKPELKDITEGYNLARKEWDRIRHERIAELSGIKETI